MGLFLHCGFGNVGNAIGKNGIFEINHHEFFCLVHWRLRKIYILSKTVFKQKINERGVDKKYAEEDGKEKIEKALFWSFAERHGRNGAMESSGFAKNGQGWE